MERLSTEEEYKVNNYFQHRHGDEVVEHAIGNSCDNLIGLAKPGPDADRLELPVVKQSHPVVGSDVSKPARSEADNNAVLISVAPPHVQQEHPIYDHSADAEDFAQTEYYSELRRRSLEGRAPVHFVESGEHTIEETLASEDFDVALY